MKFVSNAGTDRVVDLVRPWLKPNNQFDVVSPSSSSFAFAEPAYQVHVWWFLRFDTKTARLRSLWSSLSNSGRQPNTGAAHGTAL